MDFERSRAIEILSRTPSTLRAMLGGLSPDWIHGTEGPETWSPYIIVGHLVSGERNVWVPRVRCIIEPGADRRFRPFDRFAQLHENHDKPLDALLDEFAAVRSESLALLDAWTLDEAQLALEGDHPAFGIVTLRQLLSTWVVHDLSHLAQIARVMAKQYRDAVGPWREYLPLLDR